MKRPSRTYFTSRIGKEIYPRSLVFLERHVDWRLTGKWSVYSALVGVVTALGAIGFASLVDILTEWALVAGAGYGMPLAGGESETVVAFNLEAALSPLRPWLLPLIPALGGLAAGWIIYRFAPEAEGHGTDAVIRSFHRERGIIAPRVPVVKAIASALTIGTGGSAGREGPIAQIGAGLASMIAQRLRLNDRERRVLLVAGVAAGVGSIFRSPLGGAIFAVEVLYREDIETEAMMPAVIAGITGYSVYGSFSAGGPIFSTPSFRFVNAVELLPLSILAVFCAGLGILFVSVFYGTRSRIFDRLPIPRWTKPAVGGLAVGVIAFFFPAILGSSYGWLQQAIMGALPIYIMALIGVVKIFTTSLTIGSGGSGGVFAPSLVIGGMLGGVFGRTLDMIVPVAVSQPDAYVLIGMATFFAGVANVPLSTTIMISELTGSYTLLVPLLLSGVLIHVMSRRWSLYKEQVPTHSDSPAHRLNLIPDVLRHTSIGSIIKKPIYFHTIATTQTLPEILSVFARTREVVLPTVKADSDPCDNAAGYSGLVLLEDVQALMALDDPLKQITVGADLEVPFAGVHLDDTLETAVNVFASTHYPQLPVLDENGVVVSFIRQSDILEEYHRTYIRLKTDSGGH